MGFASIIYRSIIMNFNEFKVAVAKQFATMVKDSTNNLFTTNLDKDELWSIYLESFPEGTNPIR